jgi:hypothetical protein
MGSELLGLPVVVSTGRCRAMVVGQQAVLRRTGLGLDVVAVVITFRPYGGGSGEGPVFSLQFAPEEKGRYAIGTHHTIHLSSGGDVEPGNAR